MIMRFIIILLKIFEKFNNVMLRLFQFLSAIGSGKILVVIKRSNTSTNNDGDDTKVKQQILIDICGGNNYLCLEFTGICLLLLLLLFPQIKHKHSGKILLQFTVNNVIAK